VRAGWIRKSVFLVLAMFIVVNLLPFYSIALSDPIIPEGPALPGGPVQPGDPVEPDEHVNPDDSPQGGDTSKGGDSDGGEASKGGDPAGGSSSKGSGGQSDLPWWLEPGNLKQFGVAVWSGLRDLTPTAAAKNSNNVVLLTRKSTAEALIKHDIKSWFQEEVLLLSKSSKTAGLKSAGGLVGIGLTVIADIIDFSVGENTNFGIDSPEFVNSVMTNTVLGALTTLGASVGVTAALAFAGATWPVWAVTAAVVGVATVLTWGISQTSIPSTAKKLMRPVSDVVYAGWDTTKNLANKGLEYTKNKVSSLKNRVEGLFN